jgi:hypothetical protein
MGDPKIFDEQQRPLVRRRVIEARYGRSPRALDTWMKKKVIPFYRIGGTLYFSIADCDAALQRYKIEAVK